ncbi:DEAD/DEAH box helicase family protein [Patescibacteria group bacterium]|nr:DEAD/DEAH box helicase family protein [Patescibacteria group bacterium]
MPLSEADIKAKYIDPKIHESRWLENLITREYPIAQDRFFVEGEEYRKLNTKLFADYVLKYKEVNIAIIEAKAENEDPEKHLGQAQNYAKRLDVPFVYISNGKKTILYDRRTLKAEEVDEFLKPEEIYQCYLEWKKLEKKNTDALNYPLYISGTKKPRVYQEAAIKAITENIAKGNNKTLLTMATGTGKTFVAFQTIWKLVKSKHFHRILFLTDRKILRDDAYSRDFEPFGEARNIIKEGKFNDKRNIYFSTYQTLFADNLYKKIRNDFFDLIVIDECHRSRYGDWGIILDHFNTAYNLGMTATPKRQDNIDVYDYFGEPVYEYSMGQAIEDGFLVPYKIYKVTTNLYKEGLHTNEAEEVIYDDEIDPSELKDFYEPSEYERVVNIPDQIDVLSKKVVELLEKTNPYGKTIIFCVDMIHAQNVKDKLNELKKNEKYATRVVAEDKDDLTPFRDKEMPMPVIATTVDLLSTGVDIPHLQNIVFMRPISSQVLFKQIIGRGSRLFEGKGFFRIIDFTNATRLIDEWDIPTPPPPPPVPPAEPKPPFNKLLFGALVDDKTEKSIQGANVAAKVGRWYKNGVTDKNGVFKIFGLPSNNTISFSAEKDGYKKVYKKIKPQKSEDDTSYIFRLKSLKVKGKKIKVKGIDVTVEEEIEIEFEGKKLSYAEYRKYSSENLRKKIHSSDELKKIWLNPEKKEKFLKNLEDSNVNVELIKSIDNLGDSDSFDIIAHLAFNAPLLTREDRIKLFLRENAQNLIQYGDAIRGAIYDILDKYKYTGEENLSPQIFMLPNMFSQKQEVQKKYPNGLTGFMKFIKEKIYSEILLEK